MFATAKALLGIVTGLGGAQTAGRGIDVSAIAVRTRDGRDLPLAQWRGTALLLVNVASKCGCTPQYHDLAALHKKYAPRGFAVLGFPCNDFAGQEPGTAGEVQTFCSAKFGAEFDIFEKVHVKGAGAAPLYAALVGPANGPFAGPIGWNFTKFLAGRDGVVCARFAPNVNPQAPAVVRAIEAALDAPAGD